MEGVKTAKRTNKGGVGCPPSGPAVARPPRFRGGGPGQQKEKSAWCPVQPKPWTDKKKRKRWGFGRGRKKNARRTTWFLSGE